MTLLDFFRLMRKHLVFLIVAALVGGSLGLALTVVRSGPDSYTATSTLYVSSVAVDGTEESSSTDAKRNLDANTMLATDVANLIQSKQAEDEVANRLGIDDFSKYTVTAEVSANQPRIVTVSVTGPDAAETADVTNALGTTASQLANEVIAIPSVGRIDVDTIDKAEVPEAASGRNWLRYPVVGVCGGFFVAIVLVVLKAAFDTRIRSASEVEAVASVPVIGDATAQGDYASEVLGNLELMTEGHAGHTIVVTSPLEDGGTTLVASALAKAVASSGQSVLLIDANLREPSLEQALDVHPAKGLGAVVSGDESLEAAVCSTQVPNESFLGCGDCVGNPLVVFGSSAFGDALAKARSSFAFTILDAPAVGQFDDAPVLGGEVDATLMVVREKSTRREDIIGATRKMRQDGANVVGMVLIPRK